LRKELEEQAELARASKTADVFQFNLAVYEDAYRDQPEEVKADIVWIKTDEKFKDVAAVPPEREELYKKMVLRDRGVRVDIDETKLFKIATDPSVSPTIRIESVRSMSWIGSRENRTNLDFIRRNARNPSSKLNFVSLVQLMKFGEQTDKDELLNSLQGTDTQRVSTVLSAMQSAQWKEGSTAVMKLADSSELPAIKELARETASKLDRIKVDRDRLSPSNEAKKQSAKERQLQERELQGYKRPPLNDLPAKNWLQKMSMTDAAEGAEAELQLKSLGDGITQIVVNFRNLSSVKAVENYVLWGLDPNKQVVRLGQVIVSPRRREAQIVGETGLELFELFVTAEEDAKVVRPTGPVIARVIRPE
jgi:hypothetical protein